MPSLYDFKNSHIARQLKPFYALIKLCLLFIYDLYEYSRRTSLIFKSKWAARAKILELSHSVERGLSLKHPKSYFGYEKINYLLKYMEELSSEDHCCVCAASTLNEYFENYPNEQLACRLDRFDNCEIGGIVAIEKSAYFSSANSSFEKFSRSRFSVRDFSDKNVPIQTIIESVEIAQKSPSACNRQPTRVYIMTDKNDIAEILDIQGGAGGFKEFVNKLISA